MRQPWRAVEIVAGSEEDGYDEGEEKVNHLGSRFQVVHRGHDASPCLNKTVIAAANGTTVATIR